MLIIQIAKLAVVNMFLLLYFQIGLLYCLWPIFHVSIKTFCECCLHFLRSLLALIFNIPQFGLFYHLFTLSWLHELKELHVFVRKIFHLPSSCLVGWSWLEKQSKRIILGRANVRLHVSAFEWGNLSILHELSLLHLLRLRQSLLHFVRGIKHVPWAFDISWLHPYLSMSEVWLESVHFRGLGQGGPKSIDRLLSLKFCLQLCVLHKLADLLSDNDWLTQQELAGRGHSMALSGNIWVCRWAP
jgi:hypothetical protein